MDDTGGGTIPRRDSINIPAYIRGADQFTRRHISYANDICNAFAGVAGNMKRMLSTDFLHGFPQSELSELVSTVSGQMA
jgi:hypothetical protein